MSNKSKDKKNSGKRNDSRKMSKLQLDKVTGGIFAFYKKPGGLPSDGGSNTSGSGG